MKGLKGKEKCSCTVFKTNLSGEKINENQCRELCITRFVLFCCVIVIFPRAVNLSMGRWCYPSPLSPPISTRSVFFQPRTEKSSGVDRACISKRARQVPWKARCVWSPDAIVSQGHPTSIFGKYLFGRRFVIKNTFNDAMFKWFRTIFSLEGPGLFTSAELWLLT